MGARAADHRPARPSGPARTGPAIYDHLYRDPEVVGDCGVRPTLRARQHDPRAHRQRLRRGGPPRQPLQLLALLSGPFQHGFRTSGTGHTPVYDLTREILAQDTSWVS